MLDEVAGAAPDQSLDAHMAAESSRPAGEPLGLEVDDTPVLGEGKKPEATPDEQKARDEAGRFREKAKDPQSNPAARVRDAAAKEATAKRERDEARAERDAIRAENETLRAGRTSQPPPEPERATNQPQKRYQTTPAPDISKFDDWTAYNAAVAADAAREEWHAIQDKQTQASRQKAYQENIGKVLQAAQKQIDDAGGQEFLDTLSQGVIHLDPIQSPLGALIAQSDNVPGLMKYFSENEDEFQLLQTLPPGQLSRKIGRLEERLSGTARTAPSTAKPIEVSKAGDPVRPVAGKSTPPTQNPETMSLDAHIAQEQRRKRA